jgi:hypothetical protein
MNIETKIRKMYVHAEEIFYVGLGCYVPACTFVICPAVLGQQPTVN